MFLRIGIYWGVLSGNLEKKKILSSVIIWCGYGLERVFGYLKGKNKYYKRMKFGIYYVSFLVWFCCNFFICVMGRWVFILFLFMF